MKRFGNVVSHPESIPMTIVSSANKEEFFLASEGCYVTELCNSEADSAVSIARIRVRPGNTTYWHRLKNTTERYYVVSGRGLVEVGDAPGRAVFPGDVVIIPAMERQRISNEGEVDLVFRQFAARVLRKRIFCLANNHQRIICATPCIYLRTGPISCSLNRLCCSKRSSSSSSFSCSDRPVTISM